jgi:transposase
MKLSDVVVGLDVHLKNTQVTVMKMNGEILKRERVSTTKAELRKSLESVPKGSKIALESVGFCWPWIDFLDELEFEVLLANPVKVKYRAEDVKTDRVDSKLLADLTRMNWLPTCYVPPSELRVLRNLLRHRAYRTKLSTGVKNKTKSEFRKRDVDLDVNLGTVKGRKAAVELGVFEVNQNIELLEVMDRQTKEIEAMLERKYGDVKPVLLLMSIPGIGFISALTLYAEICDIKRFSNPEKLAHYAGLVPSVHQSGEHSFNGRETRGDAWLKWILIEVAWCHVRYCQRVIWLRCLKKLAKGRVIVVMRLRWLLVSW